MKQFLLVLTCFMDLRLPAQVSSPLADSLIATLPNMVNDTAIARAYNRIYNELINVDVNKAMQYARLGLAHAQHMRWPKGIAVFQSNIGGVFGTDGNYDSAITYYNKALATQTQLGDKQNRAVTFNSMGTAAQNIRSDYTTAVSYYFKALQIAESISDSIIMSNSLSNIAGIYLVQQNFTKSLEFNQRALAIREKSGSEIDIARSLLSIGKVHYLLKKQAEALQYFERARVLFEKTDALTGLADTYGSLALCYGTNYSRSIAARLKAKGIWDQINPLHTEAITNLGNLGVSYKEWVTNDTANGSVTQADKNRLLQKGEDYLKSAVTLSSQAGDADNYSYFTGVMAEVQALKGDYKNAYYNFKTYSEAQDSIYSQENKNKIAAAESGWLVEKRNNELRLKELEIEAQQRTLAGLLIATLLLILIGILLYRQSRIRKMNNASLQKMNTALDNANKVKTKFFSIISHDLRSPVARLIHFLHLQKEAPDLLPPEKAAVQQQKIILAAETLLENMEGMLLWSKSQMDNFKPVKKEISIESIFQKLRQTFISNDALVLNFFNPRNICLTTDADYLYTLLNNLIINSISALYKTESLKIEVVVGEENNYPFIIIADNGPGYPEVLLNTWVKDELEVSGRNGLGLHIVKDMAKAISCRVILSNTNTGACTKLIFI